MSGVRVTIDGRVLLTGARGFFTLAPGDGTTPDPDPEPGSGTTSIALLDFHTAHPSATYIVQRKAGTENDEDGGHADVDFEYTFTGDSPTAVQARVVDRANPSIVIKDWTTLTNHAVIGSNGFGTLLGVPAGGRYLRQIRVAGSPSVFSNGATPWGVGDIAIFWGQSNMLGTFATGVSSDIVPGTGQNEWAYIRGSDIIVSIFDENGWTFPTTFASVGRFVTMRMMAKALEAKHGKKIPVGFVLWAFSNQSIESFLPGGSASNRALLTNSGLTSNCGFSSPYRTWCGDARMIYGHQGEANNGDSPVYYRGKLIEFKNQMVAAFAARGRTHQTLPFMPAVLGVFPGGGVNWVENLRAGVLAYEQHAVANGWPDRAGWTTLDCPGPPDNTLHFQGDNKQRSLKRMIQSVLYVLDPARAQYNSSGPRLIGTASKAGDMVTLPVAGGEALEALTPGSAVTGWYAHTSADFNDANGSVVALGAVTAASGQVQVTAPSTPATFYIKHCGGRVGTLASANSDVSNLLYRKVPYPMFKNNEGQNIFTGTDVRNDMPLYPTPDAIVVS